MALLKASARVASALTFRSSSSPPSALLPEKPHWWKSGLSVYQIWPASFKDSNGDGIGDIPGIISKLDYLQELGVDIIWLSPMYDSPQVDMGYDISDYENIYPKYGTLQDMDNLIKGIHDRGMRIILDLVINHTSDKHKWFEESMKSKDNPKSSWYIWKDPKLGKHGTREPPNNWGSMFGGSAWKYCQSRDQYYLHLFAPEQPDLNWENKTTRKAIYDTALHFWLKKGVDGFRVDTANLYSKRSYDDGPITPRFAPFGAPAEFVVNGPRMHEFYQEIRRDVLDKYNDPMMVGELGGTDFADILKYVSSDRRELSMVFDFSVCTLGGALRLPPHEVHSYKLPELKTALKLTQDLVANTKAWSTVFMENHDNPRSVSRHATNDPAYHDRACKLLALMIGTLSGTLFLYQGQEIGMTNIPETWSPEDLRDVSAIEYWHDMNRRFPRDKELLKKAWKGIVAVSRDNARTPVQWSSDANAGFTDKKSKPWMRINDNYKAINVAKQLDDPHSIRSFWRRVLEVRKKFESVVVKGHYEVHDYDNEQTFTFSKTQTDREGRAAYVVLNFSDKEAELESPRALREKEFELYLSNVYKPGAKLGAWEARLYLERCGLGEGWVLLQEDDDEEATKETSR